MRESIKSSISQSLQDLVDAGLPVTFTARRLNQLGVVVPNVDMPSKQIQKIRKTAGWSQTVFAKVLNVSANAVRQWEQGKRTPSGSTKVLLKLLERNPHLLDFRVST